MNGSRDVSLAFPVEGGTWILTSAQIAEWQQAFPRVDVWGECQKALVWVKANPPRQKTARGMPRFLVAWLARVSPVERRHPMPNYGECQHANPPCANPGNWQCQQRTELAEARAARARRPA